MWTMVGDVVEPDRESHGAASIGTPKEQPPRNLSGHRTGRVRQRWKVDSSESRRRGKTAVTVEALRPTSVERQRGKRTRTYRRLP